MAHVRIAWIVLAACALAAIAFGVQAAMAQNAAPTYGGWLSGGDSIAEDGGSMAAPPSPFARSVPGFATGIAPGPPAEFGQTVRIVVESQTNTALFSSVVPVANLPTGTAATPAIYGPSFTVSGSAGSQSATLSYTTAPDAAGVDNVCIRLQDDGGTAGGGIDMAPNPPVPPLCFDITLTPLDDPPRATGETFTMYKNHILYAPQPAFTFPVAKPAIPVLLSNDIEVEGQPMTAVLVTPPTYGALQNGVLGADGSFQYTPATGYFGPDSFQYKVKDSSGLPSPLVTVAITILNNNKPTASIAASGTSIVTGQAVSFGATCTDVDAGDAISAYFWDFGDGVTAIESSALHVYNAPGTYAVLLQCYDNEGDVGTAGITITVAEDEESRQGGGGDGGAGNNPYAPALTAYAGENQNVGEGDWVLLHGSVTGAYGNAPPLFAWTQFSGPVVWVQNATTLEAFFQAPSFQGAGPKAIVLQLVASDGTGSSLPSTVQVNVHSTNQLPVVDAGRDQKVVAGALARLNASGTSDADGDALTYEWTQLAGFPVTLSDRHVPDPTFTVPEYDGTPLTFEFVVFDGQGRAADQTHVLSMPPELAAAGFTYEIVRDGGLTHVTFHPGVDGLSYVWDFGDERGSSTTPSPTYDYVKPGTYVVRMSVIDRDGVVQAFSKPVTIGAADQNDTGAIPVERASPDAGALVVAVLAGCAALASRRRP